MRRQDCHNAGIRIVIEEVFKQLGLVVLERGWLSSNNIVFRGSADAPATVVDTGYDSHAAQTEALVRVHLGKEPLERVLNTHLHSDHCGGNAALQTAWRCEVWVPEPSFDAVAAWDEERLSFRATDQVCRRFTAERGLRVGESIRLGACAWEIIAAPGHDPDAVMLFQRESGVLITADALWEERLAIIFPELRGEPGFRQARSALDAIESLQPRIVIPGHGAPFMNVARALSASRKRIAQFESAPIKHLNYAARALAMFHMLECRSCGRDELVRWLVETPIFGGVYARIEPDGAEPPERAAALVDRLISDGLLRVGASGVLVVA